MDLQVTFNLTLIDKCGGIRSLLQAIFGHQIYRFAGPKDHVEPKSDHDTITTGQQASLLLPRYILNDNTFTKNIYQFTMFC